MLDNSSTGPSSSSDALTSSEIVSTKRKRRPAGTPDPDAEVVSLSPKTLLESDKYVCEICNQGFQRDQNLQMHRRRHKVPWKLLKRENNNNNNNNSTTKRVFVCPEPTCLHHDPSHALGDLVGIKKHFRRKHSNNKQWVCDKCSKGYAVQSDYKAHLKTCGTRGHSCDCGRVFSRVESFIEHQDACNVRHIQPIELQTSQYASSSRTASSTSPSSDNNLSIATLPRLPMPPLPRLPVAAAITTAIADNSRFTCLERNASSSSNHVQPHNLELQLLPSSSKCYKSLPSSTDDNHPTHLKLSIGSSSTQNDQEKNDNTNEARPEQQLNLAMAEKAYAEEARRQAKRQLELAELDFANARRIRQQAQAELEKAQQLKEQSTKKINETILEITCHACKQQYQTGARSVHAADETSLATSYMSSATTEAEGE